ncbi:amidohydrolase family protein [Marinomonas spartinae]|uniref:amidohydrolase family protein n=1 Tax=Marinomonas spartinae TaxID=1792290 RepID=UPI0018F11BF4|nr:amidohydrolase family protein [Marinomonas spartinae]MBJ7556526.1 amidohydrolase family protein [Marinomonas spartinae]
MLPVVQYILSQQDTKLLGAKIDLYVDSLLAETSKRGLTTVLDAAVDPWDQTSKFNQPEYLKQKAHSANCPVRIAGALVVLSPNDFETKIDPSYLPMQGDDKFFLPFIKVISDGSNQGLTGYQYKTYCCDEDYQAYNDENRYQNTNHGIFNFSYPGEFQVTFNKSVARGWPIMVHANGDQAIKRTIDTFRNTGIDASSIEVRRDRIEHASLISNQSFESMRDLGISPSFLIGHVGYWGWAFQQTILGAERASLLDRCNSALQYGIKFTLHSDNGVSPLGPLRMMEQSISRFMEGAPSGASNKVLTKDECITPFEALRAVTIDAAWQCHADNMVGSLEAGKYADFVILQQSPLTYLSTNPENKVANMRDIPVLETWKGAKCVYHWKD